MKRRILAGLALAAACVVAYVLVVGERPSDDADASEAALPQTAGALSPSEKSAGPLPPSGRERRAANCGKPDGEEESDEAEEEPTEEEKAEAAEEAKVEAFDNLTDRWSEPAKAGVSMKDVGDFAAVFRAVPKSRKDECVHRALNLIPDDNVMLLAGILMDKSEDVEIVETVFNDILNRDDDVKQPILKQIFADKTHPCWTDAAWILDVTGELPEKK